MKRQGLSAKPYQPTQMINSSTQYNSATQPCCFIFDVMGWRLILYKMENIKIFTEPMTEEERKENIGKPLKMPVRYHLVDCLKDLKFGRPAENQKQIDKWIAELNENLENGVPFT